MDKIQKFVIENNCEFSQFKPDKKLIEDVEKELNVKFGQQLIEYLLKYGYLSYEYIEFYGLNSNQKLESDLCTTTKSLYKYFPQTKNLVVIENQGDGDYYLVDSNDIVYRICPDANIYEKLNIKLFDYIIERFKNISK